MHKVPIWKPSLIIVILALCGLSIYPVEQRLKPGLDLAGGTTLVYQVDVPDDQDAQSVVDQVIETLKKRVDPNGVRNLTWRSQAGNRIEIQIPLPPAETTQRRARYVQLRDDLLAKNLTKRELNGVLRLDPAQRGPELDRLAKDNPARRKLLEDLAQANDAFTTAKPPYQSAQDRQNQLEKSIAALASDASRTDLEQQLKAAQDDLIAKTRVFLDAKGRLAAAEAAVLATNIDPVELEHVLNLPNITAQNSKNDTDAAETRPAGVQRLADRYPVQAQAIQDLASAKAQYDEVKGAMDDPNDLIVLLRGSGVLEFRIAAPANLPDASSYRDQLVERGPRSAAGRPYRWSVVDDITSFAENARERQALEADPKGYFASRGLIGQKHASDYYILLADSLPLSLSQSHKDWKLTKAYPQPDSNGFPAVGFELNRVGGQLMADLTGNNRGQPMAIVLDGRVISTPTINDRIQDRGIITGGRGGFSFVEQSYLVRTLNAGSLQGRLSEDPIYMKKFGPQLGQDNLQHGLKAAVWGAITVMGLIAGYYMLLGMVANLALAANVLIILGAMAMFDATFTLPGIAGVVLTIGMAVDANVLIYERMREELQRGADAAAAVRLGYNRAMSSIVDSNLTTIITCVILNYTGTAEIKGFAITLLIGVTASMFTALFCTRVLLDYYVDAVNPKTFSMLPLRLKWIDRLLTPNVDWIGSRYIFIGISLALVIGSVAVMYTRGQDLMDIEFRSGTQVSFELAGGKTLPLGVVRDRLAQAAAQADLPELAGNRASVVTVGETRGLEASEFTIMTLEADAPAVSEAIKTAFSDVLDVQRPIDFAGMGDGHDAPPVDASPVYIVRHAALGDNINRPDVHEDVSDYVGGVVVVLDQLQPTATVKQLTERIDRVRLQPTYEGLGYRPFTVIGLDIDPSSGADGEARYRSAAVVVSQQGTDYASQPEAFRDEAGLAGTEWRLTRDALQRDTSLSGVTNFSSQVSKTMKQQAIVAMLLSLIAIVAYIWVRFGSFRYGLAGILALAHDVVISLGLLAVSGWVYESAFGQALLLSDFKINLAIVAASLTIVGYSINDTIVTYDRIRENRGRLPEATAKIMNDSINQTFSRTIMTASTTFLATLMLYSFGGEGIRGFSLCMLVGVLVGTYSTVAIAAPLVLMMTGKDRMRAAEGGSKSAAAA